MYWPFYDMSVQQGGEEALFATSHGPALGLYNCFKFKMGAISGEMEIPTAGLTPLSTE